jgi:hypothetical protein
MGMRESTAATLGLEHGERTRHSWRRRNAAGELDFATEYEPGAFTSHIVTAALVRLAGELGLDITISGYPNTEASG